MSYLFSQKKYSLNGNHDYGSYLYLTFNGFLKLNSMRKISMFTVHFIITLYEISGCNISFIKTTMQPMWCGVIMMYDII